MFFIKKLTLYLAIPAVAFSLSGCDQPGDQNRGSYTAARHMSTGSHVPQATDANSTSSVYAPGYDPNALGGTRTNASGATGGTR